MSWFKNLFNRITSEEEQQHKNDAYNKNSENDNEEHDEHYEKQYEEQIYEEIQEQQEAEATSNFKFPLVHDEEDIPYENNPTYKVRNTDEENVTIGDKPLKLKQKEISQPNMEQYAPFGSRSQFNQYIDPVNRENYNPFVNSGGGKRKEALQKNVALPQVPKKNIPSFEERKRVVQETQVIEPVVEAPPKKKFVPTDVPSPVYGFKKPTVQTPHKVLVQERLEIERNKKTGTIANQLIKERMEKERRLAPNNEKKIAKEIIIEEAQEIETFEQNQTSKIVESIIKPAIEEVREVEVDTPTIEGVREVEVDTPTIEEVREVEVDTPTIEGVREVEVDIPTIEEVREVEVDTPILENQRVSRTPINVVMLKSDKAKLPSYQEDTMKQKIMSLPDWKKNPLKVMSAYGQVTQTPMKATEEKSVEEVHPTPRLSEEFKNNDDVFTSHVVEEIKEERIITESLQDSELIFPIDLSEDLELVPSQQLEEEVMSEVVENRLPWDSYTESLALLREPEEQQQDYEWMELQGQLLIDVLSEFNVPAQIVQIVQGPTVTQFEITVGHGVKISKIKNLSDNLKLALAARDIRIEAPIPGKRTIGIEIPNAKSRPVRLSEIVGISSFRETTNSLEVALGLDLTGQPVTFDLSEMPHGLIAGATGSGKSVCINSILMSLIMKASPQDVKLMLIDPKMVELAVYDELPHLVSPVITDVKAATAALKWAVEEMERRYQLFHHMKVRHITRYNEIVEQQRKYSLKMPYLVIVIDELADLMMMAPTEVEESICRIAQKARACGIHLVLATQRPSVDVITGLIKSNIPTRIAFSVSSQIDSRTIIDSQGAERLLGRGDMLYLASGKSTTTRLQGTFVTDEEIEDVTSYIRTLGKPNYSFAPEELLHKVEREEEQDELFEDACRHVAEEGSVSISALQRKYRIGYNRAARLVEMMDDQGFVSEARGTKPRDVFLTPDKAEEIFSI